MWCRVLQVRRLQLTCGQLTAGPRLIVDRAAAVRRVLEVQAEEAERVRQHSEHRAAHRLGWEVTDEPRMAPHSPMPTPVARAAAAIGRDEAAAVCSAYGRAPSPNRARGTPREK